MTRPVNYLELIDESRIDSIRMKDVFELSVSEIESVLGRKKANTGITKLAATSLSAYAKIRSMEIHEASLRVMLSKYNPAPKGEIT
jgi:hypothetical protein